MDRQSAGRLFGSETLNEALDLSRSLSISLDLSIIKKKQSTTFFEKNSRVCVTDRKEQTNKQTKPSKPLLHVN